MFLFQRIEEVMMNYHDARRAVGEFVLHEQDKLHQYTITEVAELTYTSKATVVRFAKTLGFDGWKEFMKAYISEVKYQQAHQGDADVNYPFKEGDHTSRIIDRIKTVQMESIQDTADLMEPEMIDMAIAYLLKANRIVVFGLSPNVFLAELFRRKMLTIGRQVDIANPGETGIMARMLGKDDCAIMISYSGNNAESDPLLHVKTLQEQEVYIIGITSGGDNYIRNHVPCVLTMSSKERLYTKISNFATEESISFILNVLFSCYFTKHYQQNCNFKLQSSKELERKRKSREQNIQD